MAFGFVCIPATLAKAAISFGGILFYWAASETRRYKGGGEDGYHPVLKNLMLAKIHANLWRGGDDGCGWYSFQVKSINADKFIVRSGAWRCTQLRNFGSL